MDLKQMKMTKLRKDQRGFSLLELIIVIGLTGLVTAAITMTVFQVFNMNTRTANRMAAVSQVQQAGKLVSEDILEAQSVNCTESSGFPLTFTRTDPETDDNYEVIYTLEDMPSGDYERLERKLTITPTAGEPTTTVSIVAEYIDISIDPDTGKAKTNCKWDGVVLTFTVTATVGDESETRVYEVNPRSIA
jgi:prepilin-type N-terminal cleavage/methylation domain-containing protein